jgi:hypothetical protein
MRVLPVLIVGLCLVACQKQAQGPAGNEGPAGAVALHPAPPGTPEAAKLQAASSAATPAPPSVPLLAYSYDYGLSVPPSALRAVVARHEAVCAAAGATQCQVIGSRISEQDADRMAGELEIRAAPTWLKGFRDRLAGDAQGAGGRLFQSDVKSEDLSRQIVDTEAAIRAKTTLRDRLQQLLATRPGKLSDLLEVEQALAGAQGEIDATQSELAMMRSRVATSDLKIHYQSTGLIPPNGAWAPVGRAMGDATGIVAEVLGLLIRMAAALLPLAVVVAAAVWLMRRYWPGARLGGKPKPRPKPERESAP